MPSCRRSLSGGSRCTLLVGRGASARVLALFSDSSAFIASFAISSSLSPRVCSVKLSSSSSLSLSESDSELYENKIKLIVKLNEY
jgi:hypothetical protein